MNLHYYNRYQKFILSIDELGHRELPYTESHHIVPKCMGGPNDKHNIIRLSLREHFIAHWLLYKAYPGNYKLSYAFWAMNNRNKESYRKQFFKPLNSKSYETLKIRFNEDMRQIRCGFVYIKNHEGKSIKLTCEEYAASDYEWPTAGLVNAYNIETGKTERITSEQYSSNKNMYTFHTAGMVTACNIETGKIEYIKSEHYQANKHMYKSTVHLIKYNFRNKHTNEIKQFTKDEARILNKCEKIWDQVVNTMLPVKNEDGVMTVVTQEEYAANKEKYTHMNNQKVSVFDKNKGKYVQISSDEFKLNPDNYTTSTEGMVLAVNLSTGKNELVDKVIFDSNPDMYAGHTKGLTSVFDKELGKMVQITNEEFKANKHKYQGPCSGKVNARHRFTGEAKQIPKAEFDANLDIWVSTSGDTIYKQNVNTGEYVKTSKLHDAYIGDEWIRCTAPITRRTLTMKIQVSA
jgi:hypothetical protein